MDDLESLIVEMAAGLKLVTGMLGLTVALLPEADRGVVLKALAALRTESDPAQDTDQSQVATRSAAEASTALTIMIEKFATELAADKSLPGAATTFISA